MDHLLSFLKDNYLMVMGVLLIMFIVIRLIKTAIKWLLILVIFIGLAYYGYMYVPKELRDIPAQITETLAQESVDKALNSIITSTNLDLSVKEDKTYILSSKTYTEGIDLLLTGKLGSSKATLYIGKAKKDVTLSEPIMRYINGKAEDK